MTDLRALLARTADRVAAYREAAAEAAVFPDVDLDAVRAAIGGRLPDGPAPAGEVVDQLVAAVEPAMVATTGPRYFGFVIGGALDAATAADMLAVGWDQPAYNHLSSPASAVVEEVAGAWLVELLGLPGDVSFGFVTGAQGANTVCLAAARHQVLADVGWDVERDGLAGGPAVRVLASEERHATIDRSLRLLGLGPARFSSCPRTGMAPSTWPRSGPCWRAGLLARRSCACRLATSTPGRAMTWRVRWRRRTSTAPGLTSTGRSGCGRPRARRRGLGGRHRDRRLLGH